MGVFEIGIGLVRPLRGELRLGELVLRVEDVAQPIPGGGLYRIRRRRRLEVGLGIL